MKSVRYDKPIESVRSICISTEGGIFEFCNPLFHLKVSFSLLFFLNSQIVYFVVPYVPKKVVSQLESFFTFYV